ncbi:uncharacterized protein TNCV_2201661 [Trichonephila clavipes]|nr:uncharacterized protein TNCV_2201661 [Trichonephila clavipes]
MSKSKELSEFDRGSIVGCHLCGKSVRESSDILQKPKSTVSDVIVKWKLRGSETAEKRIGRPKVLGERNRGTLKRLVKQNRKSSLVEIYQEFQSSSGITVSSRTVRREDPPHWTVDMWKTVLWSDESRFTVWQLDERAWVWWMPIERFFSDCIVPTVKYGAESIMVWGCFSVFDLGSLVPVIGNMNSEMYVDILDNAALPTIWQ